jgi:hypothetical protein
MKLLLYILCISPLLWSYSCKQEPCIPTKYTFTEQDLEWQIYQIGQQYKYKNLTTGEIRVYTVYKVEKSVIESNDGFSSKRDRCPRDPREIEVVKIQLLTDKLEQLEISIQSVADSNSPEYNSAILNISIKEFQFRFGLQIGFIISKNEIFISGEQIKPPASTIYYDYYDVNKRYFKVYKDFQNTYYNKTDGLIEFRINNEIWQRIVE